MATTQDINSDLKAHIAELKAEKRRLELRIAKFDGYSTRTISTSGGSKSLGYAGIDSDRKQLALVKKMIAEAEAELGARTSGAIESIYAEFSR